MTLWVINCLGRHRLARQVHLQQWTRRRTIGATVSGQFLPHAPQQKQPAFSLSYHREVGHRPADWGVISFPTLRQA
jgi:hypothetical protein